MTKTNADRLNTLTLAEQDVLETLLFNPMLSNKEIAHLCDISSMAATIIIHEICKKLIPLEIYEKLRPLQRRIYIILKYSPRFRDMPDSWHEKLIDPLFEVKD